jgi:hypothetical protein
MSTYPYDYLDGNAAGGELSKIFAVDVTAAEGQCANCGATKRFGSSADTTAPRPASESPELL